MSPIAGQTAEPNGLTFFGDTQGIPGVDLGKKNRFFPIVFYKNIFSKIFFTWAFGNATFI